MQTRFRVCYSLCVLTGACSAVDNQKTTAEMISEFLREAAVLVAVFIPLDRILSQGKDFTREWFWITVGSSGALLFAGVALERIRGIKA